MRRAAVPVLAAIVLFGALLRLDAVSVQYGHIPHPEWAVRIERALVPISQALRPETPWIPVAQPYVGGDPINYLRFAREMRHFYQAHVREPVFLAVIRLMLWITGGSDLALSYASLLAGTLAILATYLLGAAAFSRGAGLIAAAALAIELEAARWAADGWRDDTFMLFVALCGWAFVRLRQRPTLPRAVVAGVIAAGACLTRISALSFVVPALLWVAFATRRADRPAPPAGSHAAWLHRVPAPATAAIVAAALVAPFLVNCWRATGDPFFAINYHTRYYRAAEGLPQNESIGALEYVTQKLRTKPIGTADTAAVGVLLFPFSNKWTGFEPWSRALALALQWCAAAGMIFALWSPDGRLLWLILVTSLAPYALTWPLGGGSEWRFTQHVYPIYLAAAGWAMVLAVRTIRDLARRRLHPRGLLPERRAWQAGACAFAIAIGAALYMTVPYFQVREELVAGNAVSIGLAARDRLFFSPRWSARNGSGNVFVRVALAERVSVRLPLPEPVEHVLTLRMDGPQIDAASQPRVTVLLNARMLGAVRFQNDPLRVGAYRFLIPRDLAGRGLSRLDLVASHTIRADAAGPRFAWLPGHSPVAFYLWYVRVEPRVEP